MAAEDKSSKLPVRINPTTGLTGVGEGADIQALRLASIGDTEYSPESAGQRLEGLGFKKGMWPKVRNRLNHELRALIRIAEGDTPRLLKDVLPEVDVEERIGKNGSGIRYFEQAIGNRSSFDGWQEQVGAEHEALIRGILFKDRTFIWTSKTGHTAMHLADNMGDKLPAVDVSVITRAPEPEQTILRFQVYPDIPDETIDLLAGYFRRSMKDSPSVQLSVVPSGENPREFTGTFSEYFQEERKAVS